MIRIYLDWNVFANLKREDDSTFLSLKKLLDSDLDILIPYSPSHLQDLKNGYNKNPSIVEKTNNDLGLIKSITKNNCIYYDTVKCNTIDIYKCPIEYFNDINNQNLDFLSLNPITLSPAYKSLRNSLIKHLKINTNPEEWGNAFDYLDSFLKKSELNKSYAEFMEEIIKIQCKNNQTYFDYFMTYYISLDTFGYHKDEKLPNLINDVTHAFYGAHCDFFVTDDKRTLHKSKMVYNHFKIKTIVCYSNELLIILNNLNKSKNETSKTITEQIIQIIENSTSYIETHNSESKPVKIYKTNSPILNFFNRIQTTNNNDFTLIQLYKKRENYSTFLFNLELKSVIDKIVNEFGIDDNLRYEFEITTEINEIINNSWKGRIWKLENAIFIIDYDSEYGIMFNIVVPNF